MGQELFLPEYTLGALSSIKSIAGIIGAFTVFVISFVGFGIVNSSIIKNALNGWYWTSPKIWDRVDQVKKAQMGFNKLTGGAEAANGKDVGANNQVMMLLGSISSFIYSLLPNVKAMSDFGRDDNDNEVKTDPKQYFMKAIPMMVVQIFVGVFIYMGYPSKVAQYFSDVGTGIFDLVLDNTDPIAFVEKLPSNFKTYTLSTDTAKDDISKVINDATKKAVKVYVGTFSDIQKEKRNDVALAIEAWLTQEITSHAEYCDSDKFKTSITAQIDNTEIDMSRFNDVHYEDGTTQYAYRIPADSFESGTTMTTSGRYLRVNLTHTPVASKADTTNVDCGLTVANSYGTYNSSTGEYTIDLQESEGANFGFGTLSKITGIASTSGGSVEVIITVNGTKISVKPKKSGTSLEGLSMIKSVSGLKYNYDTTSSPVKSISLNGSGGAVFSPVDSESGISSWGWGESPKKKSSGNGAVSSSDTSDDDDADSSDNSSDDDDDDDGSNPWD